MENLLNKNSLRKACKKIRAELTLPRREEASLKLLNRLIPRLVYWDHILSFASFDSEIDTSLLNLYLARTQRLLLPMISGDDLKVFRITNPKTQLKLNSSGIYEPCAQLCVEEDPSILQIALVPALGFDCNNHRLGYGKGFYDRFFKKNSHIQTIGIGFKEQLIAQLPYETTDIALEKVSLF